MAGGGQAPAEQRVRLYETLLQTTPDLVYMWDLQHRFTYANAALLAMWGKTWDEAIGRNCLELGYEPWHAAMHDREIEQVIATRQPVRGDVPFNGTNGRRIYDYLLMPVLGPDGNVEAVAGTTRDVTERKQHEDQQRLLLNELNHRVKNTLAIVQSIALQTLRDADDVGLACDRFESRLHALAQAHDVLTRQQWEHAPLHDIVRTAIAPCMEDGGRFDIDGPATQLDPQRALALSMALHELCTNAMKFGALSVRQGRVRIHWMFESRGEARVLVLHWQETGGPAVTEPARHGYGSRLIERGLRHDLGGDAALDFDTAGVRCRITAPIPDLGVAA